LVLQGGAFVSGGGTDLRPVTDPAALIQAGALDGEGMLILRAGKKRYCRVITA
jgi:tyrosyl-tRNA synthetase